MTAPKDAVAWQAECRSGCADTLPTWHLARAEQSEATGDWFAAAFHFGWLLQAEPDNGLHHLRRGVALSLLGRTTEADGELAKTQDSQSGRASQCVVLAGPGAARLAGVGGSRRVRSGLRGTYKALGRARTSKRPMIPPGPAHWAPRPSGICNRQSRRRGPPSGPTPKIRRPTTRSAHILYRAGQDAEAVRELNETIRLRNAPGEWADFLFLAMAQQHLGQPAEPGACCRRRPRHTTRRRHRIGDCACSGNCWTVRRRRC